MRKTSAQPVPAMIAKALVFLICAWVSATHMTDYWVIGPTFGLVVLVWRSTDVDALFKPDAAAFLVASTLIYALVARLSEQHIKGLNTYSDVPLEVAVGIGTILLPASHALLLKVSWRRVAIAIPGIYVPWFVLSRLLDQPWIGGRISGALNSSMIVNLASIWQAAYLALMFLLRLEAGKSSTKRAK